MQQRVPIDPDKGIPDLVRQLGDDSKRLMKDEVHLAKLEASESMRTATKGAISLGISFGIVVLALIAFTLFLATFFGRVANGHYWVGAFLAGAIEIALGLWLYQTGMASLKSAPYTLPETRASLTSLKLTK